MTRAESIIDQLRGLPPDEVARVAAQLLNLPAPDGEAASAALREARFRELAGSLSDEEAESILAVIEQEFERIDESA